MENWKDNNLSAILEYPFDFERYMEERLREIDDLDERKFAKKLLLEDAQRQSTNSWSTGCMRSWRLRITSMRRS